MKKIKNNQGFTLIEILVSMSIFVIFIGILMSSYTSIIRSQHEANEYRVMYAEARRTFESIVDEVRAGVVNYCKLDNEGELSLISKDLSSVSFLASGFNPNDVFIKHVIPTDEKPGVVKITKGVKTFDLNSSDVSVTDLNFYRYPSLDPYNQKNVENDDIQRQPRMTIFATFERESLGDEPFTLDLQTTISSRIYNQSCENAF